MRNEVEGNKSGATGRFEGVLTYLLIPQRNEARGRFGPPAVLRVYESYDPELVDGGH